MNRTTAMKTVYLAWSVGTLLLLGCSSADGGEPNSQQAGSGGSAGANAPIKGLAGAIVGPSGGGPSGQAGAAAGGTAAGGAAGVMASAGGTPAVGGPLGRAGTGGDFIGFGFGAGYGGADPVIRNDLASAGIGSAGPELPPGFAGFGGTISFFSF